MTSEEIVRVLTLHNGCLSAQENGECRYNHLGRCEPCRYFTDDEEFTEAESAAIEALKARKTGKWIWREDEKYYDNPTGNATYECSLCHHSDVHAKTQEVPYCWWCGSKMEVDE